MADRPAKPLVVIVGPTASGKTALALDLARQFNGEIICADSRTVYKGMDIGTAKPTLAEQQAIPHHLLDVVSPSESFNVVEFQRRATDCIAEILQRDRLPILVGGSGMYIDAVIFNYDFAHADAKRDPQNPRHLSPDVPRQNLQLRKETLVLGMDVEPDVLRKRSLQRTKAMVKDGLLDELNTLSKLYGWDDVPAMWSPAYRAFRGCIEGYKTLEEATADCVMYDSQLAKKQRTWFRRNNSIHWISDPSKAVDLVTTFLNT